MRTSRENSEGLAVARILTAHAFAPYGDVLENKGTQRRRDFPAVFAHGDGAVPALWVNRLQAAPWAAQQVDQMECHPHSAQSFLPLYARPYFVAVALPHADGGPDIRTLVGFVGSGGQGICYRPGVWHYAFMALNEVNEVAVILSQRMDDSDTIIARLAEPVRIELPPYADFLKLGEG